MRSISTSSTTADDADMTTAYPPNRRSDQSPMRQDHAAYGTSQTVVPILGSKSMDTDYTEDANSVDKNTSAMTLPNTAFEKKSP
jgi:hypothetical protein